MQTPRQYFDDSYCQIATDGTQSCMTTEDFLNRCKECGVQVDGEAAKNQWQREFFQKFKEQFFPDHP